MSTKTKQTSTSTMTPTNPEWVTSGAQGLAGNVSNLAGQDPQSFFAGPTDLTQQQFGIGGQLGAQAPGLINQAAGMAGGVGNVGAAQAQASTAAQNMGQYINPFAQQVIDPTMQALDRARQMTQNGNGQGAQLAGQYGGSRQGVLDSNADRNFLDSVGQTVGQLQYNGFNTAAGLGNSDADRFTGTSQFNAGQTNSVNLANQQAQLQGAGLLGNIGQFGVAAQGDAAGVQQGLAQQQAGAPLTVNSALTGSFGQLPLGLFNGNTQTGTGTSKQSGLGAWAQGIGSVLQGIGSIGKGFG